MCLHVVLRHACAVGVHHAEVVLRGGIPLVRSLAVPADSSSVVLRHACAVVVHQAEVVLCGGISCFSHCGQGGDVFAKVC